MQTASSETESKSLGLSICVHHYSLRAPCPKGQGTGCIRDFTVFSMCEPTHVYPVPIPSAPGNSVSVARLPSHIEAPSAHVSWPRSDAPWAGLAL